MTKDKDFKQLARARSARTGESYSTARRNLAAKSADPQIDAHRYWFTRASKGYSGKGAKPTGYESAVVTLGPGITVETSASFRNYGLHRFAVKAEGASRASTYVYGANEIIIEAKHDGSTWKGVGSEHGTDRGFSIALPSGIDPLPSVVARFLPIRLPREEGELAEYVPVPEDGFPGWKPTTVKSWFPLMGADRESLVTPRMITCRGLAELKVGRKTTEAFRYDHVDREGKVHATTWIGEDDSVVQYEQTGLLLKAVTEEHARKLDPGTEE